MPSLVRKARWSRSRGARWLRRPVETQILGLAGQGLLKLIRHTNGKVFPFKEMIKPSKAEKVLGRIEKGVHLLERGIAVAHGAYRVGQAVAPFAAAML